MGSLQKNAVLQEKAGVQGKSWPKYRYCLSCLKVRGGPLPSKFKKFVPAHSIKVSTAMVDEHNLELSN